MPSGFFLFAASVIMYKHLVKPLFFLLPPERAHHLTLRLLHLALAVPFVASWLRRRFQLRDARLEREVMGLRFANPVGLAAGFDKDGKHIEAMATLGFGFVELGTVTPLGQPGNERPRLFRLPQDEALINRLGFNNEGVEALARRLRDERPAGLIVGGNIGKNKQTPNERATEDYAICFEALFPCVDYFVVNVSSPNTPGLRDLQEKAPLTNLLLHLQELNRNKPAPKPILLKIAPDLTNGQLDDILEIVNETGIDGVIATNTTITRKGLATPAPKIQEMGPGGLSGQPIKKRATQVIRYLHQKSAGQITIIGVGGIASPEDAREKLEAGAHLIQIYTGMVYEGPDLIRRINAAIVNDSKKSRVV